MGEFNSLLDRLHDAGLAGKIAMDGQFRCHPGMTRTLLAKMKRVGVDHIYFGVESGSQTILDRMRKGYKVATIEQNLRDTHEVGIKTCINMLVGFPGETDETLAETAGFIKRNGANIDIFQTLNRFTIRPESPVAEDLERYGVVMPDNDPEQWRTRDGKNTFRWRLEGCHRLYRAADEAGVPIGFSEHALYFSPMVHVKHSDLRIYMNEIIDRVDDESIKDECREYLKVLAELCRFVEGTYSEMHDKVSVMRDRLNRFQGMVEHREID